MVELADTQDLGSCAPKRAGSTPVIRTMKKALQPKCFFQFNPPSDLQQLPLFFIE